MEGHEEIISSYPEPFIHHPKSQHTQTIILLHGTSQMGTSFGEALLSFKTESGKSLPESLPGTRFVFPTGRMRYCTVSGRENHAWFDFASFKDRTLNEETQIEGLSESTRYLAKLVCSEANLLAQGHEDTKGTREEEDTRMRIVLGGFSQGAAMACIGFLSGLLVGHGEGHLRGLVGLSGWLPFRAQILDAISSSSSPQTKCSVAMRYIQNLLGLPTIKNSDRMGMQEMKVFLGHGEEDMKMKAEWGRGMGDVLTSVGMDVRFKGYRGLAHWWNEKEIEDFIGFVEKV